MVEEIIAIPSMTNILLLISESVLLNIVFMNHLETETIVGYTERRE